MIMASIAKRLPAITKSFTYFIFLYLSFFIVFTYQRASTIISKDDNRFDVPLGIALPMLMLEFIYATSVIFAIFKGQEKRQA